VLRAVPETIHIIRHLIDSLNLPDGCAPSAL
jgi:hypothetical protein